VSAPSQPVLQPFFLGIVNLTEDSFSDGGQYLDPAAALMHARQLRAAGAHGLDLGAESSNPAGVAVSTEEEVKRLVPVVSALAAAGICVSVDTVKPAVMRATLERGAAIINDVSGFRDPEAVEVLRDFPSARAVVMFATQRGPRAVRADRSSEGLLDAITAFFRERMETLAAAGIAPERLVLDPGMGFFLGSNPEPSLSVLKHVAELRALGAPLLISTSRKSFIGNVLGGRAPDARGAGTLATELWALSQGVTYVRTHDVAPLADAWRLWQAIGGAA